MKKFLYIPLAFLVIVSSLMALGEPAKQSTPKTQAIYKPVVSSENYAAIVNEDVISLDEFNLAMESAYQNISNRSSLDLNSAEGLSILNTTSRAILDDLIDQKIIQQQTKLMEIKITSADIDAEINLIQQGFPSTEQFMATLYEEHINPDELREGIADRLVLKKIKQRLAEKITIEDREVEEFLELNRSFTNISATKEYAILRSTELNQAQSAYQALVSGNSFEDVYQEYHSGGYTKPLNIDQLDFSIFSAKQSEQVMNLKEGEYSEIIETPTGYAIYYCTNSHQEELALYEELARQEARKYLQQRKENDIFQEWFKSIRQKSYIKINKDTIEEPIQNEQPGKEPAEAEQPFINIS